MSEKPRGDRRRAVLGIDAAWTEHEPSGIAVVLEDKPGFWRVVFVAPSYESFCHYGYHCFPIDWRLKHKGTVPHAGALFGTASQLASPLEELSWTVAVDMPMSRTPIVGRRPADDALARRFGGVGCGTHSPSASRPGKMSTILVEGFAKLGCPLANAGTSRFEDTLLEVYPHPALLALLSRSYRVPYKVSKSRDYWPRASAKTRIKNLLAEYRAIIEALSTKLYGLKSKFLVPDDAPTLRSLKPYEDGLDALVAAWVAVECLEGRGEAFGDENAAIWCPRTATASMAAPMRASSSR